MSDNRTSCERVKCLFGMLVADVKALQNARRVGNSTQTRVAGEPPATDGRTGGRANGRTGERYDRLAKIDTCVAGGRHRLPSEQMYYCVDDRFR